MSRKRAALAWADRLWRAAHLPPALTAAGQLNPAVSREVIQ